MRPRSTLPALTPHLTVFAIPSVDRKICCENSPPIYLPAAFFHIFPRSMEPADLLITPRWLLPIAPANVALEGHAVAVSAGRIVAIGPVAQLESRFDAQERISRGSHALLPGFVNAHTRASMALMKGLRVHAPGAALAARNGRAGRKHREPRLRARRHSVRHRGDAARGNHRVQRFVSVSGRSRARGRRSTGAGCHRPARRGSGGHLGARLRRASRSRGSIVGRLPRGPWVSLYFAPPALFAIDDATLARLRIVADELDARIAMPVHETALEVQDSVSQHGLRPLQRLEKLGLLRPGFTAVHMNHLEPGDIARVADRRRFRRRLSAGGPAPGSGSCAVSALLQAGVPFGFGSDSPVASRCFRSAGRSAARLVAVRQATAASAPRMRSARQPWAVRLRSASAAPAARSSPANPRTSSASTSRRSRASLSHPSRTRCCSAPRGAKSRTCGPAAAPPSRESQLLAFDERELARLARQWADRVSSGVNR